METLRMIEFFSGIGGMRLAVEGALQSSQRKGRTVEIVQAYDISLHANRTYLHNFPHEKVTAKLIEQLKAKDLDGAADVWTMSPPCQPFTATKEAKGLDEDDKRCNGFKHIMQLLTQLESKPRWILLENVKGFATSRMIQKWKQCLADNGYTFREYCVSPVQIGIPNHRLRYYMMCEHSDRWKNQNGGVLEHPPPFSSDEFPTRKVAEYMDFLEQNIDPFIVADSILEKPWAAHLGVVSGGDTATHCFTASYGRILHKASGSLFLMPTSIVREDRASSDDGDAVLTVPEVVALADQPLDRTDMLQYSQRLRRFLPKELLRLFGFPWKFSFPDDIPLEHHYKLIGNSINVTLVSLLAKELLCRRKEGENIRDCCATSQKDAALETKIIEEHGRLQVGGEKGHITEEINGSLLQLYQALRWKMIPNCTGRYTCRDHSIASLDPLELLSKHGIANTWDSAMAATITTPDGTSSTSLTSTIQLPDRADAVIVFPLDSHWTVGLITFVKKNEIEHAVSAKEKAVNRFAPEMCPSTSNDENNNAVASCTGGTTSTTNSRGSKYHHRQTRTYVHTLNTPSGFRRKLNAMGLTILLCQDRETTSTATAVDDINTTVHRN